MFCDFYKSGYYSWWVFSPVFSWNETVLALSCSECFDTPSPPLSWLLSLECPVPVGSPRAVWLFARFGWSRCIPDQLCFVSPLCLQTAQSESHQDSSASSFVTNCLSKAWQYKVSAEFITVSQQLEISSNFLNIGYVEDNENKHFHWLLWMPS